MVRAGRPRSRGGILHTLNRIHGLRHARESGKKPCAGLKNHSPLEGECHPGTRASRPHPYFLVEVAERCYNLAGWQQACWREPQRQVARNPTAPTRERGRPARILISWRRSRSVATTLRAGSRPFGVNRNGKPQGNPRRPFRSTPVAETGEAVPDYGAGGTPAVPGGHPPYHKPDTWSASCPGIGQRAWFSAQVSLPPCGGVPPGNAGVPPATLFLGGGRGALLQPCGPAAGRSW